MDFLARDMVQLMINSPSETITDMNNSSSAISCPHYSFIKKIPGKNSSIVLYPGVNEWILYKAYLIKYFHAGGDT